MADEKPARWWTTMPGILTAVAALITAGTGLILGLQQVGVFDGQASGIPTTTQAHPSAVPTDEPSGSAPSSQFNVTLPYRENLRVGDLAYEILSATTRPDADGKLALVLSIRMINSRSYDANFWDASFRVIVGRDTYPASGGLNEIAKSHSTHPGEVLFVIPDTTRAAVLKIKFDQGERAIPFELRAA